jgi:hypothetical protein
MIRIKSATDAPNFKSPSLSNIQRDSPLQLGNMLISHKYESYPDTGIPPLKIEKIPC